jgi:hypothetical protein
MVVADKPEQKVCKTPISKKTKLGIVGCSVISTKVGNLK